MKTRVHSINKRGGAQMFGWHRQGLKERYIETKTDAISRGNKERKKLFQTAIRWYLRTLIQMSAPLC